MPQRRVLIIESERGWGSKIEDVLTFEGATQQEADELASKYAREYNAKYNNEPTVPDWYMYAQVEA